MKIDYDRIISKNRNAKYQNPDIVAKSLLKINDSLQELENDYFKEVNIEQKQPIVLISFLPRSGSTFLYQLLSRTGKYNYISNFQARFWRSPAIGRLLEDSITNGRRYDNIPLESEYGRTYGHESPSEFNYFWEEFMGIDSAINAELDDSRFNDDMRLIFKKKILGIMSLEAKPLLLKREYLLLNLRYIHELFEDVKIVHITRNFDDVINSYMRATDAVFPGGQFSKRFGGATKTFSYSSSLSVEENVRLQLELLQEKIKKDVSELNIPIFEVNYEDLVSNRDLEVFKINSWIHND